MGADRVLGCWGGPREDLWVLGGGPRVLREALRGHPWVLGGVLGCVPGNICGSWGDS